MTYIQLFPCFTVTILEGLLHLAFFKANVFTLARRSQRCVMQENHKDTIFTHTPRKPSILRIFMHNNRKK
uniref:Uncharacterized protein n=1 Tax=Rhizophora mucronata TaxID=61149 RepID=A0A2P2QRY2_RHIMU